MRSEQFNHGNKISNLIALSILLVTVRVVFTGGTMANEVFPVLEFPQQSLDDTSAYHGYTTRFFRDSESNAFQISIHQNTGRIVNIWADAANESMSFTVRDKKGLPVKIIWGSRSAKVFSMGTKRYVQYSLLFDATSFDIGLFLLGSMRKERDFQYHQRHQQPFESEPYIEKELLELLQVLKRLPVNVRQRHLALLNAKNIKELRLRLIPQVKFHKSESKTIVLVVQSTFDGNNHLSLELSVDSKQSVVNVLRKKIRIHSFRDQPIRLTVKIGTDSRSLNPLQRDEIFTKAFLQFYESAKVEYDSLSHKSNIAQQDRGTKERLLRFMWLDRQVKSVELLSYQEKLMAGLPNFATYFGRDMMMSALMMEPVWSPLMFEHVIASVLRKLSPRGEVSHEESLGGQAVRENAAEYNKLISEYFQLKTHKTDVEADSILAIAEKLLGNLQAVRENYKMVDDDYQLPVLVAHYLSRSDIQTDRKRAFLLANSGKEDQCSRLSLLMRNFLYLSKQIHNYGEHPDVENLVSFPRLDEKRWFPGSWRDSGAGYANGRFAMDINVVWAPKALESIRKIFTILRTIGISIESLTSLASEIEGTSLVEYARHPETLNQLIKRWQTVKKYFRVRLSPQEVLHGVRAKLDWLPEQERIYWQNIMSKNAATKEGIEFLALSLDEKGRSIPIVNTDIATLLFLEDFTNKILKGEIKPEDVINQLRIFVIPYPVGLFVEGLGPLVANDAYTSPIVWENFRRDPYHSPRVVWGREVNLLLLGLSKQILAAFDSKRQIKTATLDWYLQKLHAIMTKTLTAVESSDLKHNELWSYKITGEKLLPTRYATSSDIQLWNCTNLAVQFLLDRISILGD